LNGSIKQLARIGSEESQHSPRDPLSKGHLSDLDEVHAEADILKDEDEVSSVDDSVDGLFFQDRASESECFGLVRESRKDGRAFAALSL